jgi:glycerophosphoryl diester phosphodiesterase
LTPRGGVRRRLRGWARSNARPLVIGHRGARRRAPENTMAAFELAMSEGADGVELDVRLNRDGDVVVIHDPTLTRVTEGRDTRRLEDVGTRELAAVDVGSGERVPLLDDVLRWSRRRNARVNVELKRDVTRKPSFVWKVVRMIAAEPDAGNRLLMSSFDPLIVLATARFLPSVPSGWLVEPDATIPGRSIIERLVGAAAVHPHFSRATADAVAPWQRAGLLVNVWTVNEVDEARRLAALGVDSIISDEPGKILGGLT